MSEHDPVFEPTGDPSPVGARAPEEATLIDDVHALLDDGKTYVEAELQFQKSRVAFVLDRGKAGAALGVAALGLVHLALIALVVGLIIALAPLIGPWGATAVVVGVLLVLAVLLALAAKRRFAGLATAFGDSSKSGGGK